MQEVKTQGKGWLTLELKSGAGDLKDTPPAEGQCSAVGAANQNLQLRRQHGGKSHTVLMGFPHPRGEHSTEVVATCSQDDSVG